MNSIIRTYDSIDKIIESLPYFREGAESIREIILANLVMVSELPAPTFHEGRRIQFLCDRFNECELQNCSIDEIGNVFGILPGEIGEDNIILVAHTDTVFSDDVDHSVSVQPDKFIGPGVGDNSLGVAAVASLPTLLNHLRIRLNSNLILMGATRSLGKGNLEGLNFFLTNTNETIRTGICLEGVQLHRLSFTSIGMFRGEIDCRVPEEYDWTRFGASGAIETMNEVINKINSIPLPKRPMTSIQLGTMEGGTSFNTIAKNARLRFEVRSESEEIVKNIQQEIEDITSEIAYKSGSELTLDIVAQRKPGGIDFRHPLVKHTRNIMQKMNISPRISPSISELSAFIEHSIPAITLGLSKGERWHEKEEIVYIEPISTGLAQLIGVLLAIDGGFCDEY